MVRKPVTVRPRISRWVGVVFGCVTLALAILIIIQPDSPAVRYLIPSMLIFAVLGVIILVDVERSIMRRRPK